MTKHTITFPQPIVDYLGERMAEGGYASLSDYVSELITDDMARRNDATGKLRSLLDDAEKSGLSERSLDEILDYVRAGRKPTSAV